MRKLSFIFILFLLSLSSFGKNLYYGRVVEVDKNADGSIKAIEMYSDYQKEFIFNISNQTYSIDSGRKMAIPLENIKENEGVYIFYGDITTASIPPQSQALAIVRNIPQDAMIAQYFTVEEILKEKDGIKIVVDNGGLFIKLDEKTTLFPYRTKNIIRLKDIRKGSKVMVWYQPYASVYPGNTYATHLMLLPEIK